MYRFRERPHHHRKLWLTLLGFVIIACLVVLAAIRLLRSDTDLGQAPPPVTKTITANTPKLVAVNEPLFSISLPADWRPRVNNDIPKPTYSWHGTTKEDNTRWLNVYVDDIPANLAVNRVLPIQGSGDKIIVASAVSDNCVTFTGAPAGNQNSFPAKWQGINFLCDTGNYTRDVVGTSSPDGVNTVVLSSADEGTHQFFFTYTDNSSSPDYSIFTDALETFHLK
ncbi:MAG TPA: hypothetical protein VF261_00845 [Candidatus Saccharimonadales bacterium]